MSQDQPGQPQHRARVPKAPPPNQNRENEPITVYARRFGAKSPGRVRSWLTPLNPLFPINWENGRSDELHQVLGDYQKEKLYNFTTRELKDLDALCDRPVKEPTLKGCIIPLLRRERWEDKPSTAWRRTESVPIKDDPYGGRWQSSNDRVWNALKPAVILASQYLLSSQSLAWFDALLLGPRRWVIEDRYPPGTKVYNEYHTFHPREGPWTMEREQQIAVERDRVFQGLIDEMDYTFSYFYANENPRDNDPPNHDPAYPVKAFGTSLGVTTINTYEMLVAKTPGAHWRVQTFINVGAIEPFLFDSDDLSGAERSGMIFRLATTISHEIIHALGFYQALHRLGSRFLTNVREGWFEDEQMAELGWSWQWAMHGGIDTKKPQHHRSRRLLASFAERIFPSLSTKKFASKSQPVLRYPPIPNYSDIYPIGVQFYEDVLSQDFWDIMVRNFGGRIFQYRTVKEGTRITYDEGPDGNSFMIRKRDRLDPNLHDPFETEDAYYAQNLLSMRSVMTGIPSERRVMNFVAKLAESGKTGKEFWERVNMQLQSTKEIIEVLIRNQANDRSGSNRDLGLMTGAVRQVVELLVEAASNHDATVSALLEKQRQNEDPEEGGVPGGNEDISAKRALLGWNRGTRGFNREVLEKFGGQFAWGELANKLDISYNMLEKCQALLFHPVEGEIKSDYPTEQKEFDVLFEAAKAISTEEDYHRGKELCSGLVSDRYVGSFAKSVANILMASCEVENLGGLVKIPVDKKYQCWQLAERGLERLMFLRGEIVPIADGWTKLFDKFIDWGTALVTKLHVGLEEVRSGGEAELSGEININHQTRQRPGMRDAQAREPEQRIVRKRTRDQVQDFVEEEMQDVVYADPQEWSGADRLRRYRKRMKGMHKRGERPPE